MLKKCETCGQPVPTPEELEKRRARQRRWQAKMRADAKAGKKLRQTACNRPESGKENRS